MTDRYRGFVVTLDKDVRSDDAQPTLEALRMIRGVVSVVPVTSDIAQIVAYESARTDIVRALQDAFAKVLYRQYGAKDGKDGA